MGARVIEILNPRAKTIRQKNEAFHVKALRKHPYFEEIVKRIVGGGSAQSIAKWCESSASKADCVKNYSFFTWRLYVSTLRQRIKVTFKESEIERPVPTLELVQDVVDQVRRDNGIPFGEETPEFKPHMARIWSSLKKAIRQVDAEMVLKCAFLIQADRVEKLIQKEEETGVISENGYKEILVMKDIGAELRKFEVGEQMLRGGKSYAYGGRYSRKPPELHPATTSAPVAGDPTDSNNNSFVARFSRLDVIDRNLIVAATSRVIEMIELETEIANAEAGRVETNPKVEASTECGDDAGPADPDESANPANI